MLHVSYIYLHDWVIYGVNVGKYSIHGAYGIDSLWFLAIVRSKQNRKKHTCSLTCSKHIQKVQLSLSQSLSELVPPHSSRGITMSTLYSCVSGCESLHHTIQVQHSAPNRCFMWLKHVKTMPCLPPICEWFIPPTHGEIGDGL